MRRLAARLLPVLLALALAAGAGCSGPSHSADEAAVAPPREAYEQGYYEAARTGYEDYLRQYPKGAHRLEAWQRLLEIALNVQGDLDAAIAHLEAMSLEFSDETEANWPLMSRLARLYEQRGRWNKSLETWEKSLSYADQDPAKLVEANLSMARIYRAKREYGVALELLARSEALAPDDETRAHCQYEVAQTYSFMQSWGQAKEVLEIIVANRKASKEIHTLAVFLLADVYEQEMDFKKARELFEAIREDYPNRRVIDIRLANLGKTRPPQPQRDLPPEQ